MWFKTFLESLPNSKQLCYKHIGLILLLTRPHITNKATLAGFLESLIKVVQLIYCHQGMIHNLTDPINTNIQAYSEYEQSNIGHLLFL